MLFVSHDAPMPFYNKKIR